MLLKIEASLENQGAGGGEAMVVEGKSLTPQSIIIMKLY